MTAQENHLEKIIQQDTLKNTQQPAQTETQPIHYTCGRLHRKTRDPNRDKLIQNGYKLNEMEKILGLDHSTLVHYIISRGLTDIWKEAKKRRQETGQITGKSPTGRLLANSRDPERDELIKKGYKLNEMEKILGLNHSTLSSYIKKHNLQKIWEEAKKRRQERTTRTIEEFLEIKEDLLADAMNGTPMPKMEKKYKSGRGELIQYLKKENVYEAWKKQREQNAKQESL